MDERAAPSAVAERPAGDAARTHVSQLRLELLGGFRLMEASRHIDLPLPSQRLLAVLALHGKPVLRSYVAGVLWPDVTEDRARGNLRSTVWRLGAAQSAVYGRALLCLHPDVQVDVAVATQTARQVIADEDVVSTDALGRLVSSREVLPDWYDEWLVFEREQFDQLRLLALDCLGHQLLQRGRVAEATLAALSAAKIDSFRESSQELLIECYVAQGNRGAAVRQFRAYASMLSRELGLEPPAKISGLMAALVATVA